MRIALSNIAWDASEDEDVAALLNKYGVDAIDAVPGKYFPDLASASAQEMLNVKTWWAERGIQITGMQALLFGTTGLSLFGDEAPREAMFRQLSAVCRIGGGLGAERLVFGSPKNRDRGSLSDADVLEQALPFFRRLGDVAEQNGVLICLEPNPTHYGANYMTTSAETAQVVRAVAHPAVRMQLDTGALTLNGEDVAVVLDDCAFLIGHIHASEPDLLPLGDGGTDHARVYAALVSRLPHHVVSIEMVATKTEPHLVSIERALQVALRAYRPDVAEVSA
jgi:D-psicose/D-tagatose/L-ribulose 3-epimerase